VSCFSHALSLFLLAALGANAQEAVDVLGTVADPGGIAIPSAIVQLSASSPDRHYHGQTDTKGRFRITGVVPGNYEIEIRLEGFQSRTFRVRVDAGKAADVGIQQLSLAPCNSPGGPICDDFYYGSPKKLLSSGLFDPAACPNSTAVRMLKHQIAYQRAEGYDPLRGLSVIHAHVWMRGPVTGFYIREPMYGALPTIRDSYIFNGEGLHGGGSCPIEQNWQACIEGFAEPGGTDAKVATCEITIDQRRIPAWRPSPDSAQKRQIAREVRRQIEDQWGPAQKIVVRDFNLADNQLTIYMKTTEGDEYHGCGFRAMKTPHCESWRLFGQSPIAGIRKWIFARPYVLK